MEKIQKKQIDRLKEILKVPTFFRKEHKLLEYLINFLSTTEYDFTMDNYGNIYIVKGKAEHYPCVCAHTDSVQQFENAEIRETFLGDSHMLIGHDLDRDIQCGIGADDKAGVFICLELLDIMPVIKVALFASEEYGCIGSGQADLNFFEDVGYVIEFDCPGNSDITHYCNGIELFETDGEFFSKVKPILEEKMPQRVLLHNHPYTDVWALKSQLDVSCINIATGYYRYHSDKEYVVIPDVFNAIDIGKIMIETLGLETYEFKSTLLEHQKRSTRNTTYDNTNYKKILNLIPKNKLSYVKN